MEVMSEELQVYQTPATKYTHQVHKQSTPSKYTHQVHKQSTHTKYTHQVHQIPRQQVCTKATKYGKEVHQIERPKNIQQRPQSTPSTPNPGSKYTKSRKHVNQI